MFLDAAAAKALFTIVLATAQGPETVNQQIPLHAVDHGDTWLVTGTPYTNEKWQMHFCMCDMFFSKRSAEVLGVDCHGRMILTEKEKRRWSAAMTPQEYARIFGPATQFEPNGIPDIWLALYHGIVTTPAAAVDYAIVLMHTKSAWARARSSDLIATEHDDVWRIGGRHKGTEELITISKRTGKLLSGDL